MTKTTQPLRADKIIHFPEWHYTSYMLMLAQQAATNSNDPQRAVGCVLGLGYKEAVSYYSAPAVTPAMGIGWNTIPDGVALEDKQDHVIHAEHAAITEYNKYLRSPSETLSAFITRMPCASCAARLIAAGVKEVFFTVADERASKWYTSFIDAADLFAESSVHLFGVSETAETLALMPIPDGTSLNHAFVLTAHRNIAKI
jgi:deoxycytidylate deaminase